jgi:hypothetical protein
LQSYWDVNLDRDAFTYYEIELLINDENIYNESRLLLIDVCEYTVSLLKKDFNKCLTVSQGNCDSCPMMFSIIENDLSYCDNLSEYNDCFLSRVSSDWGTCAFRYARQNQRFDLCPEIEPYGYPNCELNVALENKDPTLCEQVERKDECYYEIARRTNDISLCNSAGLMEINCIECINEDSCVSIW